VLGLITPTGFERTQVYYKTFFEEHETVHDLVMLGQLVSTLRLEQAQTTIKQFSTLVAHLLTTII